MRTNERSLTPQPPDTLMKMGLYVAVLQKLCAGIRNDAEVQVIRGCFVVMPYAPPDNRVLIGAHPPP